MTRTFLVAAATAAALVVPTLSPAQTGANFSGRWHFNATRTPRGENGISFPSELVIKHAGTQVQVDTDTVRQEVLTAVYPLGGEEITVPGPSGITTKGKAAMEGDKLVITSRRSFSSPAGEVVADSKEVFSVAGELLTVEKTQTIGGVTTTAKAVYDRVS
jgi:hypothetical protein